MSEFTTANLQFIEDYDRVEPGEASKLAHELLALRERAEPVAYRYRFRPTREAAGKWILVDTLEEANPLPKYEVQPLYTAPPAPVVPTFDEWLEIRGNKPLGWVKDAMRESYDACRDAMLAAPTKN